jgi:quercetin dioxygenase-like cupin family protein
MVIKHLADVLQEPPTLEGSHGCTRGWLINQQDGAEHYTMKFFELEPGGQIPLHAHEDTEHEIFIFEGKGIVHDGETEIPVIPGDALFIKPREQHSFINNSTKPLKFICVTPIL